MPKIKVKTLKKKHVRQMTPAMIREELSIHYHMAHCLGRMEDTGNVVYQEKMNKKLFVVHNSRFIEDHNFEEWQKLPQLFVD